MYNGLSSNLSGSSPLVRGAPLWTSSGNPGSGIIPARAGSTSSMWSPSSPARDHPRSCGEHLGGTWTRLEGRGSSPLVRGALAICGHACPCARIIPARAGSTRLQNRPKNQWVDHPRSCGEHPHMAIFDYVQQGSSPLVRGALRCRRAQDARKGIIPARAGSTHSAATTRLDERDHPRSCGEHILAGLRRNLLRGSSPLVRGAPFLCHSHAMACGIIPARAGSTTTRQSAPPTARDHPRSCGEHIARD